MAKVVGVVCAVVLHLAFVLFGGAFLPEAQAAHGHVQDVDLLDPNVAKDAPKPEPEPPPEDQPPEEVPPDAENVIKGLDQPAGDPAPALSDASLGALADALAGNGAAGGDFASGVDFTSGGRIGGTGKGGPLGDVMDKTFSMAEIDQKPRATVQTSPIYPPEMRHRKVEGVVTILFVCDANGKVVNPIVEKSSHPAFEKPAIDAVKQWRFEPAIRAGKRVACKMRIPIRFPAQ